MKKYSIISPEGEPLTADIAKLMSEYDPSIVRVGDMIMENN